MNEAISNGFASIVLPDLDYGSQLIAIRHLLRVHENIDNKLIQEIKDIENNAKSSKGVRNEHDVDEWINRLHSSCYQDAAHSMSAVGMLAPLMESIFYQAFNGIQKKLFAADEQTLNGHIRWAQSGPEKWNCHFVWDKKSGWKINLVRGIIQLSDATELTSFLPNDIKWVLTVLFAYRNKMFHFGFEWPKEERKCFWDRIENEDWPPNWLAKATIGDEPWMIYLTSEFIWHCVETIEQIINSLDQIVCEKRG